MTNAAAIGYGILALRRMYPLVSDQNLLNKFEALMTEEMDLTTEDEAEKAYKNNY